MNVPLTIIARALSGDATCLHRLWYELHHGRPKPHETQLAAWNIRHTREVRRVALTLEGDLEAEVPVFHEAGMSGRIDLVQLHDGERIIHEVKSGKSYTSDLLQLMLYLALMTRKHRNVRRGMLHRFSGTTVVEAEHLPPDLLQHASDMAAILSAPEPPKPIQERACFWCTAHCPFAMGESSGKVTLVES